jgi:biotin transport system substrate-specific component
MSDVGLAPSRSVRPERTVLADLVVGLRDRTLVLVLAGTLLTALASQIRIPLGFTPVPINLGTFAVVLTGGVLGARRGAMSIVLYLALGVVGLPFFQGGNGGWTYATGATAGYLVGYLVMVVVVGAAAERGRDRRPLPFLAAIVLANAAVYVLGATWLASQLGVPMFGGDTSAWELGVRPFLAGDAVKMIAAALMFPAAWRFIGAER